MVVGFSPGKNGQESGKALVLSQSPDPVSLPVIYARFSFARSDSLPGQKEHAHMHSADYHRVLPEITSQVAEMSRGLGVLGRLPGIRVLCILQHLIDM